MTDSAKPFIQLQAFNLWEGCAFLNWSEKVPFVVVKLIRNSDTEEVIVLYREVWDDDSDMVPTTRIIVLAYAEPVKVIGNIVNTEEISDNNWGDVS